MTVLSKPAGYPRDRGGLKKASLNVEITNTLAYFGQSASDAVKKFLSIIAW